MTDALDYVVVGGGTAGCVIAARLSEDAHCRVLLLEAGTDADLQFTPADPGDAHLPLLRGYNWDLQAIRREEAPTPSLARAARVIELATGNTFSGHSTNTQTRMPYPMAKVLGGGSAINGALAFHAPACDFDLWAERGNDLWSWEHVSPFLARLEQDDPERPRVPIEIPPTAHYTRLQGAFREACLAAGFPDEEARATTARGVAPIPRNTQNGRRVSAARLYLPAARRRRNLSVWTNCEVQRLLVSNANDGAQAQGVEARVDNEVRNIRARNVVLCAGAVHSPAILLRSGIGSAAMLRKVGIRPVVDSPAVGRNLADHTAVSLWCVPEAKVFSPGEPIHQMMLRERTDASGPCDLHLYMLGSLPTMAFGGLQSFVDAEFATGISVVLATPRSTGSVELVGPASSQAPRILLNCLAHPDDLRRMMNGVRLAYRLLTSYPMKACTEKMLMWDDAVMASDTLLADAVRKLATGAWHPVGTLRMGRENDPEAAVDQLGAVRGCRNLTVADASIMPAIPSVPTNLTCLLIGERIASFLRSAGASGRA